MYYTEYQFLPVILLCFQYAKKKTDISDRKAIVDSKIS